MSLTTGQVAASIAKPPDIKYRMGEGEGDSAVIRQKVAERGLSAATKSDVNKTLYANQNLFRIDHSEGAKPIWKLNDRDERDCGK